MEGSCGCLRLPRMGSGRVGLREGYSILVQARSKNARTTPSHHARALVAEGYSNKAVAERLFVTDRTVEAHLAQVFSRLGIEESPESHRRVLAVLTFPPHLTVGRPDSLSHTGSTGCVRRGR